MGEGKTVGEYIDGFSVPVAIEKGDIDDIVWVPLRFFLGAVVDSRDRDRVIDFNGGVLLIDPEVTNKHRWFNHCAFVYQYMGKRVTLNEICNSMVETEGYLHELSTRVINASYWFEGKRIIKTDKLDTTFTIERRLTDKPIHGITFKPNYYKKAYLSSVRFIESEIIDIVETLTSMFNDIKRNSKEEFKVPNNQYVDNKYPLLGKLLKSVLFNGNEVSNKIISIFKLKGFHIKVIEDKQEIYFKLNDGGYRVPLISQ